MLDDNGALVKSDYLHADREISSFIAQESHPTGNVIVIDAPLVCVNASGQRPCEKLVGKCYGKFHASCHSSNKQNIAGQRGPRLVRKLRACLPSVKVSHDARCTSANLWPVIETYPHPGHIEMFCLPQILKYKKGRVSAKREGMRRYTTLLKSLADPPLGLETIRFLDRNVEDLKGKTLKEQEDLLDSLFCSYTAFYLWHHRKIPSRWRVIKAGDSCDFITIPVNSNRSC